MKRTHGNMKNFIRIICLLLAIGMLLMFIPGCGAFEVNQEKDAGIVVAVVNGEKIPKSEFNDYRLFNEIVYALYGYSVTGEYTEAFVTALYSDFVDTYVFKYELEKAGVTITQAEIEASRAELMQMIYAIYPDEASLEGFYASWGLTKASFEALVEKEIAFTYYATKYDSEMMDKTVLTDAAALRADGTDVPFYIFYYYAIMTQLENYLYEGTYASTEQEYLALYDDVAVRVKNAQAIINYCEKNGIEATEDDIASAQLSLETIEYYVGGATMQSMYDGYYLTAEQVGAARTFMARATALQTTLENQIENEINPSDADLKKYMQKNIDDYDASTVSAYHILVATETAAKALEDEAGGTAEGFMAVYEKYKGNATIMQAVDLGTFRKSDMVEAFSEAAFKMEPGDVVGRVKTDYGYHLIYVYDKTTVELPAFEEIKEQVRADYIASVRDEKIIKFLNKIIKVSVSRKNYSRMPGDMLIEKLYETYHVKLYLKRALRD